MRLDDGRVIPNFMKQALTGKDLTVYGDGEQTRSFCYVSDMIDGLLTLLHSNIDEPVNIGNPDERSILDLAEVIREVTDSESDITYKKRPPQDPEIRRPDISKARLELEWAPDVSLNDGLTESIQYFESQLQSQ
jgi:dTDP-glucose 4,6-dehydratase